MSPTKEPFYFCPDVRVGPRPRLEYPTDEARYLKLFAGAGRQLRAGEACTRYLGSVEAPALVRAFAPDAYIVVSLRDPIAMMQALHDHRVAGGNETIAEFADALAADEDRRQGKRLPPGANSAGAVYRIAASYADQLERWFAAFDRERVHIIVFDDLKADPAGSFRSLLEFLDVDSSYRPTTFAVHNRRHRQRPLVRAVVDSRPARFASERLLPALLGEARRARLAQRFLQSRLARREINVEPIDPGLRAALEEELAPDLARLSALLGRDMAALWFGRAVTQPPVVTA
ncbi:MAG TPA: sulfotransferase domain-containing protein [Candidatus Limnocylindria bacterium]|nr:sulfotransferase domain-containing protein [Candidatus Limnocylindria bacterium]